MCYGEVENVEFNSDGVLGIIVYYQNCKGSVLFIDLSLQVIVCIVQVVLDIVCYILLDFCVGVVDKELLVFDVLDFDLFYFVEVFLDEVIELVVCVEQVVLQVDKCIINIEGGSFNSYYGVKVFGNSYGMLQGYCLMCYLFFSCVIVEENGDMECDYVYIIGCVMSDL